MSVTALWSKVTLKAVDATPLPNNCQSLALFLESLSHWPGGASCHNFAQGMGLSFGGGFGVENRPASPSPRPTSSQDECGEEAEKGPAQVVKVSIISFLSLHQKAIGERHLTLLKDPGPLIAICYCYFSKFICICKLPKVAASHQWPAFSHKSWREEILPGIKAFGHISQAKGMPLGLGKRSPSVITAFNSFPNGQIPGSYFFHLWERTAFIPVSGMGMALSYLSGWYWGRDPTA